MSFRCPECGADTYVILPDGTRACRGIIGAPGFTERACGYRWKPADDRRLSIGIRNDGRRVTRAKEWARIAARRRARSA